MAAPVGEKVSRRVKIKTMGHTEEGLLSIINETENEHLVDKIEELEKNEVGIAQHKEKSAARRSKMAVHGSRWWVDIHKANECLVGNEGWLSTGFRKVIGNESSTLFWRDCWLKEVASSIYQMKKIVWSVIKVHLKWRRPSSNFVMQQIDKLSAMLQQDSIVQDRFDVWKWKHYKSEECTVKK
ncbi:hypothetical protein Ancab_017055, partial [Ancistrocladus abbreviatus]